MARGTASLAVLAAQEGGGPVPQHVRCRHRATPTSPFFSHACLESREPGVDVSHLITEPLATRPKNMSRLSPSQPDKCACTRPHTKITRMSQRSHKSHAKNITN